MIRKNISHIHAALLAAVILENSIRKLCERKEVIPENGKWKPLAQLIAELEQRKILRESQVKELLALKDIRNYAVHGQFEKFTVTEVEKMLEVVKRFVKVYL